MQAPTPSDFGKLSLGDLVWVASAQPVLEEDQEDDLIRRARAGDVSALDQLVLRTLRIAIDEAIRTRGLGEPQRRLIRQGVTTLLKTARLYDPIKDGRFSSYARNRVRHAISERVS